MSNLNVAITFTCYKRLDYLQQVLDGLRRSFEYCNTSLPIFFCVDRYDDNIPNYIRNINWADISIIINKPSIGCNKNTKLAISMGLQEYDAIIHLEDDTVPTKDAINFFIDNLIRYKDDETVYSIGGYTRTTELDKTLLNQTAKRCGFTCWGCGFWKHKSDVLLNNWIPTMNRENQSISWDSYLNDNVFIPNNLYQITPLISRIQNIGAENGTWVQDPNFHNMNHRSPYTSDDAL
jgi:hypothetical protein